MKIKTIMCNSNEQFYKAHAKNRQALSSTEVELMVVNIPQGPQSLETAYDEALAGPYILEQVCLAESEGCDAVVLDCAADPVLRAAKEVSNIPVVGAGESSYLFAMQLCNQFTVISVLPCTSVLIRENINKYGFSDRLASVRSANLPVLGLEDDTQVESIIFEVASKAIKEDGADAIVLGCTGMMAVRTRLEERLGVPVIEPYTAGVQMAAALVRFGLRQSPLAFEKQDNK